jgi:hypothetical protein
LGLGQHAGQHSGNFAQPTVLRGAETMTARRFPPPWTVEDKDTYFIVRDQQQHH